MVYRKATFAEAGACADLGDICFNEVQSFRALTPKSYRNPTSPIQHMIADEDGCFRAMVALWPNPLTVCGYTLKTGYVGNVCVHPGARHAGHMKKLIPMTIESAREQGVDLMLLGGQRQRYEYFGFAKGGAMMEIMLYIPTVRHALRDTDITGIEFTEILPGSAEEASAAEMHESRIYRFDRNNPCFAVTCLSFNGRAWLIKRAGEAIGFCTSGEGMLSDLYLKDKTELHPALKAWMRNTGAEQLKIQLPLWESEYLSDLALWAEEMHYTQGVQARILNYPRVLEALLTLKATYCRLDDGEQSFRAEGQLFTVSVKENRVSVTDGGENPIELDTLEAGNLFLSSFDYSGKPFAGNWFPLPLFVPLPDEF